MMLSFTEENYLKALQKIVFDSGIEKVGTNERTTALLLTPATVCNMLKKLKQQELVDYEQYGKVPLTKSR